MTRRGPRQKRGVSGSVNNIITMGKYYVNTLFNAMIYDLSANLGLGL